MMHSEDRPKQGHECVLLYIACSSLYSQPNCAWELWDQDK